MVGRPHVTVLPARSKVNSILVVPGMSKLVLFLVVVLLACSVAAQDIEVRIVIDERSPTIAAVEGHYPNAVTNLSFLKSYAGVTDLPARISNLKVADTERKNIQYKEIPSGEYIAERAFTSFAYNVDLSQQRNVLMSAHVSWSGVGGGMLAMDDLLPQPTGKTHLRLTLDLPPKWAIITDENRVSENTLDIPDAQRAVVFIGSDWRVVPVTGLGVNLVLRGDTQVPDTAIARDVSDIYNSYSKLFGPVIKGPSPQVVIARQAGAGTGSWAAETRGSTVTILTGGGLSPSDAEQRLLQQLRHELFHLWLPNGVNLTGSYDWFYEGFATYEEQKLGVGLNQIRFADFLATLGRAFDIDRFTSRQGSLIDASQHRWSGSSNQIYARGMLVAFLTDVAMLDSSKGKWSAETLLRQLVAAHRPPAVPVDGNEAVLGVMRSREELRQIADDYVAGTKPIDWTLYLQKAGLEAQQRDQLTSVSVIAKPNGRQKDLLDKLGYNNWLKLSSK